MFINYGNTYNHASTSDNTFAYNDIRPPPPILL
jgi:hypothetical protein